MRFRGIARRPLFLLLCACMVAPALAQDYSDVTELRWVSRHGERPDTHAQWSSAHPVRPLEAQMHRPGRAASVDISPPATDLLIVISSDLHASLDPMRLITWTSDLQALGYEVVTTSWSGGTVQDLRAHLASFSSLSPDNSSVLT